MWKIFNKCVVVLGIFAFASCTKGEDTASPDISDLLTNRYCNNPNAVNYNWNFPGIEDNATCFFSYYFYEGDWIFIDTIRRSDSSIVGVETYYLNFEKIIPDTSESLMAMSGWCSSASLIIHVDRFYFARTDSFDNNGGWQKMCSNSDSIFVQMRKDIVDTTALDINIQEVKNNETFFHRGKGKRN